MPIDLTEQERETLLARVSELMREHPGLTLAQAARIALREIIDARNAPTEPPPEPIP